MKRLLQLFGYYHINDIIKDIDDEADLWERSKKELDSNWKLTKHYIQQYTYYKEAILILKQKFINYKINGRV